MTTRRFRDPTSAGSLYTLAGPAIDVVCPRCAAHARVLGEPGDERPLTIRARRLVCAACGHAATWTPQSGPSWWGAPVDPFFRRPLWLTANVRGHVLWAYNWEHLQLLQQFVAAGRRERGPRGGGSTSMMERLPAWLTSARNRAEVLAAVARLEEAMGAAR